MNRLLADFAATLRAAGVPVSAAESLDAARALEQLSVLEGDALRCALRTTLIKSQRHREAFERCFEIFFNPSSPLPLSDPAESGDASAAQLEERWEAARDDVIEASTSVIDADPEARSLREALVALLEQDDPRVLRQIQALASGDVQSLGETAREGAMSGLALLQRRLQAMTVLGQLRGALRRFARDVAEDDPALEARSRGWLEGRLRRLDRVGELLVERAPARANRTFNQTPAREGLEGRGIVELFSRDRELLVEVMQRLVRKIATAHNRRARRAERGRLDVRRTLRESLRTGGVPVRLSHRRPKRRKGAIVVLCDVSGSVRAMAQATLAMIHALANCWEAVRVFTFTDDVEEISARFDGDDPEAVLREVMETPLFSASRASNYGRAFRRFEAGYGDVLGPRTTLIILGDARNNGHLTEHHLVEGWQRRARRVLWLNPEPANAWDSGDSEASAYRPFCTEFRACTTLGQLTEFVERLR